MTRRILASAALAGAVLATVPAAPAGAALCRLQQCPVVRDVCSALDCEPPFTNICFYGDLYFCV